MKKKHRQKPRPKRNRTYVPSRRLGIVVRKNMNTQLTLIEDQIKEHLAAAEEVIKSFQAYQVQVQDTIKELLVESGVYDQIHEMELEREEVRKKAEERIQELRGKLQEAHKIRDWLASQPSSPAPVAEVVDLEPKMDPVEPPPLPVEEEPAPAPEPEPAPVPVVESKASVKKPTPPKF